jgi:predicted nucleotidyltransferase
MESVSGEVVLFGSYAREEARGEARGKDSDVVDLLVLPEGEVNGWQESLKIEPVS